MEHRQNRSGSGSFIITVPPVACSFPWKIHPDSLKLKEMSDAWLVERSKGLPAACKSKQAASFFSADHLIDTALHLLTMLFFGNATATHLLLPIVEFISWQFLLDNFMDNPSEIGSDPVQAKRIVDSLVAVFKLPQDDVAERTATHDIPQLGFLHSLMDSAREWWEELCGNMNPSQQARFRALVIEYVQANQAEVRIRASPQLPDLQTYMQIRRASIGWFPLDMLTECSLSIELDAEALAHPLLILLKQHVCEHIILTNDIISFGKEYMQGDLFNAVFILCFKKVDAASASGDLGRMKASLSKEMVQEGVLQVNEMIKERDRECVRIMEEITRSPVLMSKPGMEAFMQGLGLYVGGNLYWHLVSARYGLSPPPTPNQPPDLLATRHVQLSFPN